MTRLVTAILAHHHRECLDDLLANVRTFAPSAEVVVFNGGRDSHLTDGLDVEICPASRPLGYQHLARFHYEIMRWLAQERRSYDFMLTLDSDVLLIKSGLESYLEATMKNSSYMAVDFREILPTTSWVIGRRFHYKWKQIWQPIFGTRNPYGCFNPCQVFRKEYADRLLQFAKLDELLQRIDQSRIPALDEMVYATLAVTLDCAPLRFAPPVSSAVRFLKWHAPSEIISYCGQRDVHMIHPVAMELQAPDRRTVRALREGQKVDIDALDAEFKAYQAPVPLTRRIRNSFITPVLTRLHDVYLQVVPE